MIGEYQRIKNVEIKHVCLHVEAHRINHQPGFGSVVDSMASRPCSSCLEKVNDERHENHLQD